MSSNQLSLLEPLATLPQGFEYRSDLVSSEEEAALLEQFQELHFREYEFHGHFGKRRVVSFGMHYDPNEDKLPNTDEIPAFLLALRQKAADFARLSPSELRQALVTEYTPGAAIGWHRDRPFYRDVIGMTLRGQFEDKVAFLGIREDASHEIALFQLPKGAEGPDSNRVGMYHMAWEMASFEDLQQFHERLLARNVRIAGYSDRQSNVMFLDPDGNELEAIWEPSPAELERRRAAGIEALPRLKPSP